MNCWPLFRTGLGNLRDTFPSGVIRRRADSLGTPHSIQCPSSDQAGAEPQAAPMNFGPFSLPICTMASCLPSGPPTNASEFPSGDQAKPAGSLPGAGTDAGRPPLAGEIQRASSTLLVCRSYAMRLPSGESATLKIESVLSSGKSLWVTIGRSKSPWASLKPNLVLSGTVRNKGHAARK